MAQLYLKNRFFIASAFLAVSYAMCFAFDLNLWAGHIILSIILLVLLFEFSWLSMSMNNINARRSVHNQLSLGDNQFIEYHINNDNNWNLSCSLIDELPKQLQSRNFDFVFPVGPKESVSKKFKIRPTVRGLYNFGKLHLYLTSRIFQFIELRKSFDSKEEVEVYPSILQMKKYELETFNQVATLTGIKRVRRVGQNDEFEHIRKYSPGDNIRSINWKATSRHNKILVNQFQDTRSQSVYCIIDKGRSMKMPFNEMSLLDYAINSTLVLSNIILKKYDRSGLVTFNDSLSTIIQADNRSGQLSKITKMLFNEVTGFKESNFKDLYFSIRRKISRRSILILFTNFEHTYDMRRALPFLRQLNKLHLLVVIFFTNTEILGAAEEKAETTKDIYAKTFAQKALIEKDLIVEELRAQGIQTILSTPEELSVNVINKYLEIKAKRMR